jgi:hypothetical protein
VLLVRADADVDDLRKAIKAQLAPRFDTVPVDSLFLSLGGLELSDPAFHLQFLDLSGLPPPVIVITTKF